MNLIRPHTGILPSAQQALWPFLPQIEPGFVLYGGTAVALHFGHRQSVDFDFFSHAGFDPYVFKSRYDFLKKGVTIQLSRNTLSVLVPTDSGEVQLSFFGGLTFGRVVSPSVCEDNFLRIASPLDLAIQKLKVIQVRSEAKDYLDLDCLFQNGVELSEAMGAAKALYPDFPVAIALRALCYFEDGDVSSIPSTVQERMSEMVRVFTFECPMTKQSEFFDLTAEELATLKVLESQ